MCTSNSGRKGKQLQLRMKDVRVGDFLAVRRTVILQTSCKSLRLIALRAVFRPLESVFDYLRPNIASSFHCCFNLQLISKCTLPPPPPLHSTFLLHMTPLKHAFECDVVFSLAPSELRRLVESAPGCDGYDLECLREYTPETSRSCFQEIFFSWAWSTASTLAKRPLRGGVTAPLFEKPTSQISASADLCRVLIDRFWMTTFWIRGNPYLSNVYRSSRYCRKPVHCARLS